MAHARVAGPALALGLRRRGFEVTVVERAPALRAGGYKVDVRGAGVTALRLGLYEAARAADVEYVFGDSVTGLVDGPTTSR